MVPFYVSNDSGGLYSLGMKNGFVAIHIIGEGYALFIVHNGKIDMLMSNSSSIVAGAQIWHTCITYEFTPGFGIAIYWWGVSTTAEGLAIGV